VVAEDARQRLGVCLRPLDRPACPAVEAAGRVGGRGLGPATEECVDERATLCFLRGRDSVEEGELWQHRRQSAFAGEDEHVFCHPERGSRYSYESYKAALEAAAAKAGLELPEGFRPCHDLRVTAITSDALAGAHPIAVMTKAGHANMATTKRYLKLAGAVFRKEAESQEQRLLGRAGVERTDSEDPEAAELSTPPSTQLSRPEPPEAGSAPLNHPESGLS
jgi:integrase